MNAIKGCLSVIGFLVVLGFIGSCLSSTSSVETRPVSYTPYAQPTSDSTPSFAPKSDAAEYAEKVAALIADVQSGNKLLGEASQDAIDHGGRIAKNSDGWYKMASACAAYQVTADRLLALSYPRSADNLHFAVTAMASDMIYISKNMAEGIDSNDTDKVVSAAGRMKSLTEDIRHVASEVARIRGNGN